MIRLSNWVTFSQIVRKDSWTLPDARHIFNLITFEYLADTGGAASVPGERDARRRDLHRARQEEDGHGHRRGLRPQEAGQDPLWLRILMISVQLLFYSFISVILLLFFKDWLYYKQPETIEWRTSYSVPLLYKVILRLIIASDLLWPIWEDAETV